MSDRGKNLKESFQNILTHKGQPVKIIRDYSDYAKTGMIVHFKSHGRSGSAFGICAIETGGYVIPYDCIEIPEVNNESFLGLLKKVNEDGKGTEKAKGKQVGRIEWG